MANLKINRGTTYTRTVSYSVDGEPTTLVGATVRFTMKDVESDESADDSTALVAKEFTDGDANGVIQVVLDPADTSEIRAGDYFYDIKVDVNSDASVIYKLDEGTVELDGSPTNRLA